MKKRFTKLLSMVLVITMLCGCQANPDNDVVISKNDGAFDANVLQSATEPAGNTISVQYTDTFTSTDGTVEFSLNINENIMEAAMPVVEVVPHFLSGEEVEHFCVTVLGEGNFYLDKPEELMTYSRQQLQTMIARWSEYTTADALEKIGCSTYGDGVAELHIKEIKDRIAEYTKRLENTSENTQPAPCNFVFDSISYSGYEGYEDSPLDNRKYIEARADRGELGYLIYAGLGKTGAIQESTMSISIGARSPMFIDHNIFYSWLCRTDYPTQEQIDAAQNKAQAILDEIGLGEWTLDTYVQSNVMDHATEYQICVMAQPAIRGIPTIQNPAYIVSNMNGEGVYSSHYDFTSANFQFAPDGTVMYAGLFSPTDEYQMLNENVATMPMDDLIQRAKEHLSLSDYYAYGVNSYDMEQIFPDVTEEIVCRINICKLDYGMLRVPVKDTNDHYYYVPGIALSGTIDFYGKETGNYYGSTNGAEVDGKSMVTVLTLNAIDGTVIDLVQNY